MAKVHDVTVLWNGGWDSYRVDFSQVRPMTSDEISQEEKGNRRLFPTFGQDKWLKGRFIAKRYQEFGTVPPTHCVRILQCLGGGD